MRIRTLIALASLGTLTATASAAASDCTALRGGTSDFDQVRAPGDGILGLPNDGRAYCYPTTWVSWMAYLNQNGFPSAMGTIDPVPDWSDPAVYNLASFRILVMGAFCQTNAMTGTGYGEGVMDYLRDAGLGHQFPMSLRVVNSPSPHPKHWSRCATSSKSSSGTPRPNMRSPRLTRSPCTQ